MLVRSASGLSSFQRHDAARAAFGIRARPAAGAGLAGAVHAAGGFGNQCARHESDFAELPTWPSVSSERPRLRGEAHGGRLVLEIVDAFFVIVESVLVGHGDVRQPLGDIFHIGGYAR